MSAATQNKLKRKLSTREASSKKMTMITWLIILIYVIAIPVYALQPYSWTSPIKSQIPKNSQIWYCQRHSIRKLAMTSDDDEFDDDDDYDDEPPKVDVSNFTPPSTATTFGFNSGRSAPSQRKAMGTAGTGTTSVHVCTNCGCESVKWMGRCPTCKEWNTMQEFAVPRGDTPASGSKMRPTFGRSSSSWLDGIAGGAGGDDYGNYYSPVRVTDIIKDQRSASSKTWDAENRLVVPDDDELNNVLGGGIMKGSLVLVGGDPGVGKSTLLLQTAGRVASESTPTVGIGMGGATTSGAPGMQQGPVWYVSGEETMEQIAARAERLGIQEPELYLYTETHVNSLAERIAQLSVNVGPVSPNPTKKKQKGGKEGGEEGNEYPDETTQSLLRQKPPCLLIMDSIQTLVCDEAGASAPGGVTQVRECVGLLLRLAKTLKIPVLLVGHVTKSGDVAGPKTVEHMVDAVLYLEGSDTTGSSNLRLLRASKNRFGSSTQVGMYEWTYQGSLAPIADASSLLLANRITTKDSEGCAVALVVEGIRVLTVEVQALVTGSSSFERGGRRTVNGLSQSRLLLLLGVLQKYCRVFAGKQDVYINVVGGIQLSRDSRNQQHNHASDLAVVVAVVSSWASIPARADTACCGEVGLLGELRPVSSLDQRLQEAARMGFSRVITPPSSTPAKRNSKGKVAATSGNVKKTTIHGMEWVQCATLRDAIDAALVMPLSSMKRTLTKKSTTDKQGKPVIEDDSEDMVDGDGGGVSVSYLDAPGAISSTSFPGSLQELGLDSTSDDYDDELPNI